MPEGFVYLQVLLMEMSQVYYTHRFDLHADLLLQTVFSYNNYYCMTQ